MSPEEAISQQFHPKNTIAEICTEMATEATAKIDEIDSQISLLQRQRSVLADRRGLLDHFRSNPDTEKLKLIEEVITEKLRREQIGNFAFVPSFAIKPSDVEFVPLKASSEKPEKIKGTILKAAHERGMEGSAFDPTFDPAPDTVEVRLEPEPEAAAPFERVDIGSIEEDTPSDAEIEAAESEEDSTVEFYREGVQDERVEAHPGDAKAATVSSILAKTKARDRGKLWRKIVQSAGATDIAQFNRYTVATALCFSNRTLNDALEGFVAQGNIEMLAHDDESWVKMRILRR